MALTLPLVLPRAGSVGVRWDVPDGAPVGLVLLLHGFGRGPAALDRLADGLSRAGLAVARPAVSAWRRGRTYNDVAFLTELATTFARATETGVGVPDRLPPGVPLVPAGHSAGGAAALHAAAVLAGRPGVRAAGLLLLDPTDSLAGVGSAALPDVADVPALVVAGPASRCNRGGGLTARVAEGRDGFVGVRVTRGGHGDAEGDPTRLYRWACGDATAAEDVALVHQLAVGWAGDLARGIRTPGLQPGADPFDGWVAAGRVVPLVGSGPGSGREPSSGR